MIGTVLAYILVAIFGVIGALAMLAGFSQRDSEGSIIGGIVLLFIAMLLAKCGGI